MSYNLLTALDILLLINSVIIIILIVLERRKPERTIAWIIVLALFPYLGLLFYVLFGRMWHKRKPPKGFSSYNREIMQRLIRKLDDHEIIPLIRLLMRNSNSPLFINNQIKIFKDGTEKFPALLEEIQKAEHHIHLEYFIVHNDLIGKQLQRLLIEKAREGVKVRFIIDRIGSFKTSRAFYSEMRAAGVDVVSYPYVLARFLNKLNIQLNYRNHRKIVVIDGKVGFIGGANIGDEYWGLGKMGYWRDTHLMIRGDFVYGLQAVFFDDFLTIKRAYARNVFFNEALKKYYPSDDVPKGSMMQFVTSGPDTEQPAIMQSILKMISVAESNIYITTPYFVPNESIMDALRSAALSGVDVRIIFPGKYDHYIVYMASMTYLSELITYGAKVYFYDNKAFLHAKVITIDGKIASVGSSNMDVRSFFLNYELNAVIYDERVVTELDRMFFEDIRASVYISNEYFDKLSVFDKFIQAIARIFSALL